MDRRPGWSDGGALSQLKRALKRRDNSEVQRLVSTLRMGGMRPGEIWEWAREHTTMTLAQWDTLVGEDES